MEWRDRTGKIVPGNDTESSMLKFLYGTSFGRAITWILVKPWVSKSAGRLLDHRISAIAIPGFLKNSHIDMKEYEQRKYHSFNDFFTRKVLEEKRPIDRERSHLIAPCDSKLTVYPITEDAKFQVKNTWYTMESLLQDGDLAKKYQGGVFLLFRLTVDDYHRYCYPITGKKSVNRHIPGVYYTVNPIANDFYPIYKENTREYTLLKGDGICGMLMMEVGATMVGRIVNEHQEGKILRGQEKGRFEFGGSTVILCIPKDQVQIDPLFWEHTRRDVETVVKMGEKIGTIVKSV